MPVLKDQEMEREKGMGANIGSAKVCDAFDAEPRSSAQEAGQPETLIYNIQYQYQYQYSAS
jgi:hypothetical protein